MRIAIVGSGAMGIFIGHGIQKAGHEVTMIDLPDRVKRLKKAGRITVADQNGLESSVNPSLITSDFVEAGKHQIIILATKAQDLPGAAENIAKLTDGSSTIIPIQNGIPWWYLHGLSDRFKEAQINCLDPEGLLNRHINPSQVIGCVAYPAVMLEDNGRARHIEGKRFSIGEVIGPQSERTQTVANLFQKSGFKCLVIDDIRSEIWLKAWGALSINPISALTHATMEDICTFPNTRELVARMMEEAQQVAETLGAHFRHTIEKRIEGARAVGPHKTSMLQDLENGHALELDALMLAVLELAKLTGIQTPTIRNIYACASLLNWNIQKRHEMKEDA
ncbi:2-dehydropantoate 2-reductase [Nitrosomonas marina]|uniref:2-dehydropantoate 2-reductase n=1 Tax=Nitrosomonas marina TaxID=917 RepID=A0A1H8I2E5_9PROT|nr:2-dehydropantoate 2-reductase [Nitrosomonas marina]SEN62226.1 ketopantoate reductase [Nitrosomonas marina]